MPSDQTRTREEIAKLLAKPPSDQTRYALREALKASHARANEAIRRAEAAEGEAESLRLSLREYEEDCAWLPEDRSVEETVKALTRQRDEAHAMALMSPSSICEKHHVQACHCCERIDCGDNTSPAKQHAEAAEAALAAANERIAELEATVENLRKLSLMSPSKVCAEYHMQGCFCCDSYECGDNQSPAKARIATLEQECRDRRACETSLSEMLIEAQERVATLEADLAAAEERGAERERAAVVVYLERRAMDDHTAIAGLGDAGYALDSAASGIDGEEHLTPEPQPEGGEDG